VHGLARDDGLAVLWATHLIDEILDDDALIVLHKGNVIDQGRAADVVSRAGTKDLGAAFEKLTGEGMS
jgi:ABC-2 type transport system ATP-binding protein